MAKEGKLQCQETRLLSGKSKTTFAMGVAGSSVAAVTRMTPFVAVTVNRTTKTQRKIKKDG